MSAPSMESIGAMIAEAKRIGEENEKLLAELERRFSFKPPPPLTLIQGGRKT